MLCALAVGSAGFAVAGDCVDENTAGFADSFADFASGLAKDLLPPQPQPPPQFCPLESDDVFREIVFEVTCHFHLAFLFGL